MEDRPHPTDPRSNVAKFGGYNPENYALNNVSSAVLTDESLIPGRPPCLTQRTIGKFLQPFRRGLIEEPQSNPMIDELPDAVIENMVQKDRAYWVDKPGVNAYTLHDAYYNYGMTTEIVLPTHQDVFPRSYQYDLDCVRYRRQHAGDNLKYLDEKEKTPFQLTMAKNPKQKRLKAYPDISANLTAGDLKRSMNEVGRPFKNEICNWYYVNYPPVKYDCIVRKFSK